MKSLQFTREKKLSKRHIQMHSGYFHTRKQVVKDILLLPTIEESKQNLVVK